MWDLEERWGSPWPPNKINSARPTLFNATGIETKPGPGECSKHCRSSYTKAQIKTPTRGGRCFNWGERWGSNPRHPRPQPGALPTELRSPRRNGLSTSVMRFMPHYISLSAFLSSQFNKQPVVGLRIVKLARIVHIILPLTDVAKSWLFAVVATFAACWVACRQTFNK